MKNSILIILLSFLVTSFAFGQECPPLDNINPESLCTASDGTDGVLIFGDCYSIENTIELNLENQSINEPIPSEIYKLYNLKKINFSFNQITGEIPIELYELVQLNDLLLNVMKLCMEK